MTVGTTTIHELDTVELLVPLPDVPLEYPEMDDAPLHPGDRGAVVMTYVGDNAFTVEFFRNGETVAITDVSREQVRRVEQTPENESEAVRRLRGTRSHQ